MDGAATSTVGASDIAGAVDAIRAGAQGSTDIAAPPQTGNVAPTAPTYGILKQTHPAYDASYWRECRALYEGGRTLLRDEIVMGKLFPRHREELQTVYRERKARAFYVPYPAEIIDHLVAGVASDPISVVQGGESEADQSLPDFYEEFVEDVSPDGGAKVPLGELLTNQLRTALQTCWTWTLVDLPQGIDDDGNPIDYKTQGDQEKTGALRAYAIAIEPESVVDWEDDDDGDLMWALVRVLEQKRTSVLGSRAEVTERWTYYTRDIWAMFERKRDADKGFQDSDPIPLVKGGKHSFGRVPLIRFSLTPGLWAMNKMHSIAVEHFNKRSALGWGETQALLPELYEGMGPEVAGKGAVIGEAQEDANRAVNQRRGQGFVQVRGKDDWAKFIGPDVAPFAEARNSCDALRDDLHRVMHQMALAAANNSAALKRSAESKEQDRAAVDVVLRELGRAVRKHAEAILDMVSRGRREDDLVGEWAAKGMSDFNSIAVSDSLKNALDIDMLRIESPTFRKRHRMMIAREVLEGAAKPEDLDQIEKELEENITDESVAPGGNPPALDDVAADGGGSDGFTAGSIPKRGRPIATPPAGSGAAKPVVKPSGP